VFMTQTNSIQIPINVQFIPDCMIVRQIAYKNDGTGTGTFLLYSDITGGFIGSFNDPSNATPATKFILNRPISGNKTFTVYSDLTTVAGNILGELAVTLEFVQYAKNNKQLPNMNEVPARVQRLYQGPATQ